MTTSEAMSSTTTRVSTNTRSRCGKRGPTSGSAHAAERGEDGHGHAPPLPQFAHVELAPHLQTDDEEEEGHQAVVDPATQLLGDPPAPQPDGEPRGPHGLVGAAWQVGPDQADQVTAQFVDQLTELRVLVGVPAVEQLPQAGASCRDEPLVVRSA